MTLVVYRDKASNHTFLALLNIRAQVIVIPGNPFKFPKEPPIAYSQSSKTTKGVQIKLDMPIGTLFPKQSPVVVAFLALFFFLL